MPLRWKLQMALHHVSVANTIIQMAFAIDFFDLRLISFHSVFSAPANHEASSQRDFPRILPMPQGIDHERHASKRCHLSINQKVENLVQRYVAIRGKLAFYSELHLLEDWPGWTVTYLGGILTQARRGHEALSEVVLTDQPPR